MHRVAITAIVVVVCAQAANGFEIGDKVVVTEDTNVLSGEKVVGSLKRMTVVTVDDVSDTRVRIPAGWIEKSSVTPLKNAVAFATRMIEQSHDKDGFYIRGALWQNAGNFDSAINDFTEVLKRDPRNTATYFLRGLAWRDKGDYEKAIADFNALIPLDPTAENFRIRGELWGMCQKHDKALADLGESLRLNPRNPAVHANRAVAWCKIGYVDRAIQDLDEAIRLDPSFTAAYLQRGTALYDTGRFDEAIADLTEVIKRDPANADAYHNRAAAWDSKGNNEKSIADMSEAIRLAPGRSEGYVNRALSWMALGAYEKARQDLEMAVAKAPNEASMHSGLAWLLATCPDDRVRDGERAIGHAKKACDLSGGKNRRYLDTMAAALAEVGRFDEACETQEKVVTLSVSNEQAEEAKNRLGLYKSRQPFRENSKK